MNFKTEIKVLMIVYKIVFLLKLIVKVRMEIGNYEDIEIEKKISILIQKEHLTKRITNDVD